MMAVDAVLKTEVKEARMGARRPERKLFHEMMFGKCVCKVVRVCIYF